MNRWNRVRYTLWAPVYDWIAGFRPQRERALRLLDLRPGESVLILGCGTGADLPFIPPKVHVTAIDITPAMLEHTRRRAAALGRPAEILAMDGQCLSFDAEQFDAVILHLILSVVPDPVACIREAERVLWPGGRAVIFDKFAPDGRPPSVGRRLLNLAANLIFSDITRQLGPLLAETEFTLVHKEAAWLGGQYQIALLQKPEGNAAIIP